MDGRCGVGRSEVVASGVVSVFSPASTSSSEISIENGAGTLESRDGGTALLSVDVLSPRSDVARDGAAEAMGERVNSLGGLGSVPIRKEDLRDVGADAEGCLAVTVYAGEGPLSSILSPAI